MKKIILPILLMMTLTTMATTEKQLARFFDFFSPTVQDAETSSVQQVGSIVLDLDEQVFKGLNALGEWVNLNQPSTGGSGELLQIQRVETTANTVGTTLMIDDNTIPQNTEGDEVLTLDFTPRSAFSKLIINVELWAGEETTTTSPKFISALFRDLQNDAVCATAVAHVNDGRWGTPNHEAGLMRLSCQVNSNAITQTTFSVRAGVTQGSFRLNGVNSATRLGQTIVSSMTITEYL